MVSAAATTTRKPRAPRKAKAGKATEASLLAAQAPAMPDRSTFLGGSDFAAVMGLSPWHTPVELWKLKTKRTEPKAISAQRKRMLERGKKLEPFVLDMLLDKLREQGLAVELVARNSRYRDAEHAFLSVEIDFELRITGTVTINGQDLYLDGELVNGDAKTVHGFARRKWGEEETEDVPIEYAAQFMGGLMVCPGQRQLCIVAALIGLDDVAIYWVRRDDETIAAMREKLVGFWVDHVVADVPPDALRFSDIRELFPLDNGKTREATPAVAEKLEQLRKLKTRISMAEAEAELLLLDIGAYAEDFSQLTVGGRLAATFKRERRLAVDMQALRRQHGGLVALFESPTESRVLRLKQTRR